MSLAAESKPRQAIENAGLVRSDGAGLGLTFCQLNPRPCECRRLAQSTSGCGPRGSRRSTRCFAPATRRRRDVTAIRPPRIWIRKHVRIQRTAAGVWRPLPQAGFGTPHNTPPPPPGSASTEWDGAPGATLRDDSRLRSRANARLRSPSRRSSRRRASVPMEPYAIEPGVDYSSEPTTLVSPSRWKRWKRNPAHGVEWAYADPASRRAKAFEMNRQGGGPDGEHQAAIWTPEGGLSPYETIRQQGLESRADRVCGLLGRSGENLSQSRWE